MKKRKRRKILVIPFFLILLLLGSGIVLIRYTNFGTFQNSIYISPIPSVLSSHTNNQTSGFSKELEGRLRRGSIPFTSINYIGQSAYRVKGVGQQEILFTSSKSLDSQISSLQLILSSLTME